MRMTLFAVALLTAGVCTQLPAASICPATASTNTDCSFIITIGSGGSISGAQVPGANPYDGSDDALIGVINNSGAAFTGPITLSGTGNGGGLFAFDGDGICAFTSTNSVSLSYCSSLKSGSSGYEGPLNTFTGISSNGTTGTVSISGLANGATTFFSLESSPASTNGGTGPVIVGSTPEPATLSLIGSGLLGLFLLKRRNRA